MMRIALALFVLLSSANAFAPSQRHNRAVISRHQQQQQPLTQLNAAEAASEVDIARIQFFVWFFGASGGAGIARSAFPRMFSSVQTIQGLKDVGPTKGGPGIGVSTLLTGYPRDLAKADVEQIVNNKLTVEQIVAKYPVEGNFLAERGYLTFQAFAEANKNANPLAVRAIFDTFNTSTDIVDPETSQKLIDLYKKDPKAVAFNLLKAKLIGFSSIFTLLFLLGLADVVAFGHAKDGWFPTWPGLENLPWSLFSSETGVTKIPDFWLGEY